jgi:hypothetical protein
VRITMRVSLFIVLLFAGSLYASGSVIWLGTGNTGEAGSPELSAMAAFDMVDNQLVVTLTNTSTDDVLKPMEVLTAVFFTLPEGVALNPVSSVLAEDSTILFAPSYDVFGAPLTGGTYAGGDVGAEWAYRSGLSAPPLLFSATSGISSVGLGVFGPGDRFDTVGNLQGPDSPNGLQYGITSAGDNPATGNAPVTGHNTALIQNAVRFTFDGVPGGFSLSQITDVWFQYGTDFSEPYYPSELVYIDGRSYPAPMPAPVPEPASLLLLGLGLGGMVLRKHIAQRASVR